MKSFLFISITTIMFASCEPLEIKNSDYFIFGHFYGYCVGEGCVEIFKIEGENLYEDENDFYPTSTDFNMAKWKMLDKTEYEKVKNIGEFIPEELLNENKKVIGQPDAGDWGGIYIEIKVGEVHKFWLMDKMRSNVPEEYHEFLDKLEEKINLLQNTQ